jgi:hypothetical protein
MSDTEDYPGPTHKNPDKEGQDAHGRADEDMVKPPAMPKGDADAEKGGSAPESAKSKGRA